MRKKITGSQFHALVASYLVVLSYVGLGIFDFSNVYRIINGLVPTSTMVGQEVFIILPAMMLVYACLSAYLIVTTVIMLARVAYVYNNMKGGN